MSLPWSEWQPSAYEKKIARVAFSREIDDETEAKYVLKGILKRKGLPLTTTYDEYKEIQRKTRKGFDHDYDEAYCDRLYEKIRKQQQNPDDDETTESSSAKTTVPPPVPVVASWMSPFLQTFDEREWELQKLKSFNNIVYRDPEASLKRDELCKQALLKRAELRKKLNVPTNIFAQLEQQLQQQQQSPSSSN